MRKGSAYTGYYCPTCNVAVSVGKAGVRAAVRQAQEHSDKHDHLCLIVRKGKTLLEYTVKVERLYG